MSTAAGQVEGDLPLRGHELELLALCSALVCIQASLSCWQSLSIPCVHLMMLCPAGGCWPLASGAVPGQGCLMQPLCLPILTLQVAQPPLCRLVSPSPTSPATAIKVSGTVSGLFVGCANSTMSLWSPCPCCCLVPVLPRTCAAGH